MPARRTMSGRTVERSGSPATKSTKTHKCGAAKGIGTVYSKKVNSVPGGDLLARTIAHRPPNEDRIRGIAA